MLENIRQLETSAAFGRPLQLTGQEVWSYKAPPCDLQASFSVSHPSLVRGWNPRAARTRVETNGLADLSSPTSA
jgi:hypothetical protein